MRIGIYYNVHQADPASVGSVHAALEAAGAEVFVWPSEEEIGDCDRLVVLGGDGTVLRAAKQAAAKGIPLFGVNYGRLGFLTEFERGEDGLAEFALGEGQIVKRDLLEVDLNGVKSRCLNELALLREVSPERSNRVESVEVSVNGKKAGEFVCDGLIVATPTGSTAYSLSAGGCIMTPDCRALLLTPINAFSLKSRPIVCHDTSVFTFSISEKDALMAYGDGMFLGRVGVRDRLTVKKSGSYAEFLTRDKQSFFLRLAQKIN